MDIKKVKVAKGTVVKEIDSRQEKDYVKNGWTVVKENKIINPFAQTPYNNYTKK